MARDYARVRVSIWADDDFRSLTAAAQHLYFTLLTAATLSHAGVADWRPGRLAPLAADLDQHAIRRAASELIHQLYIVVDVDTEEVLIRSFVRHDGLLAQPKMAVAMANAHAGIASPTLRGIVVHELQRLRAQDPGINAWADNAPAWCRSKMLELLGRAGVDPRTMPLGNPYADTDTPAFTPADTPAFTPTDTAPIPESQVDVYPSTKGCPTPAPKPYPKTPTEPSVLAAASPARRATPAVAATPDPVPLDGMPEPRPPAVTAQTLVGEWIDAHATRPLPKAVTSTAGVVNQLLDQGADPDHVRAGLTRMRLAQRPSTALPDLVEAHRQQQAAAAQQPPQPATTPRTAPGHPGPDEDVCWTTPARDWQPVHEDNPEPTWPELAHPRPAHNGTPR